MFNRFYIKNVGISVTNIDDSVKKIMDCIESLNITEYVCVTNVRATYIGNNDSEYCDILNNSFLTVPDGKPLEWYAHIAGYKTVRKTSGNDLFEYICKVSEKKSYTHYFYGSTQEVINNMINNITQKYPAIKIVGAVAPPYLPVEELITNELIDDINEKKPQFVWVGLGAPKQERFISILKNKIYASVLIGVGLVFDYQAGTVSRAPKWMQNYGLEGVYRCLQQSSRVNAKSLLMVYSIIPIIIKEYLKKINICKR